MGDCLPPSRPRYGLKRRVDFNQAPIIKEKIIVTIVEKLLCFAVKEFKIIPRQFAFVGRDRDNAAETRVLFLFGLVHAKPESLNEPDMVSVGFHLRDKIIAMLHGNLKRVALLLNVGDKAVGERDLILSR